MKLLKLEVKNFKPFRELVLPQDDAELPNGLIIIKGPNSTGKSSLFESILWSLWGAESIGLTNDDLISFSSTFCHVILQFEVAGARFRQAVLPLPELHGCPYAVPSSASV